MPYPERSNGAGSGNQEFHSASPRKYVTFEQSELHAYAEKTDRGDGKGLLDTVAI